MLLKICETHVMKEDKRPPFSGKAIKAQVTEIDLRLIFCQSGRQSSSALPLTTFQIPHPFYWRDEFWSSCPFSIPI